MFQFSICPTFSSFWKSRTKSWQVKIIRTYLWTKIWTSQNIHPGSVDKNEFRPKIRTTDRTNMDEESGGLQFWVAVWSNIVDIISIYIPFSRIENILGEWLVSSWGYRCDGIGSKFRPIKVVVIHHLWDHPLIHLWRLEFTNCQKAGHFEIQL